MFQPPLPRSAWLPLLWLPGPPCQTLIIARPGSRLSACQALMRAEPVLNDSPRPVVILAPPRPVVVGVAVVVPIFVSVVAATSLPPLFTVCFAVVVVAPLFDKNVSVNQSCCQTPSRGRQLERGTTAFCCHATSAHALIARRRLTARHACLYPRRPLARCNVSCRGGVVISIYLLFPWYDPQISVSPLL